MALKPIFFKKKRNPLFKRGVTFFRKPSEFIYKESEKLRIIPPSESTNFKWVLVNKGTSFCFCQRQDLDYYFIGKGMSLKLEDE